MSPKESYFLRPMVLVEDQNPAAKAKMSNETILFARQAYYDRAQEIVQERVGQLKKRYGSWQAIPNRLRTELADNLRYVGFTYEPRIGWIAPNSVSLSSL